MSSSAPSLYLHGGFVAERLQYHPPSSFSLNRMRAISSLYLDSGCMSERLTCHPLSFYLGGHRFCRRHLGSTVLSGALPPATSSIPALDSYRSFLSAV
jgi:hypothetical protein